MQQPPATSPALQHSDSLSIVEHAWLQDGALWSPRRSLRLVMLWSCLELRQNFRTCKRACLRGSSAPLSCVCTRSASKALILRSRRSASSSETGASARCLRLRLHSMTLTSLRNWPGVWSPATKLRELVADASQCFRHALDRCTPAQLAPRWARAPPARALFAATSTAPPRWPHRPRRAHRARKTKTPAPSTSWTNNAQLRTLQASPDLDLAPPVAVAWLSQAISHQHGLYVAGPPMRH